MNRETGEVIGIMQDAFAVAEALSNGETPPPTEFDVDEEMIEQSSKIEFSDESEKYLRLPDRFEIHEWSIMQDFCESLSHEPHRIELLDAINRKGAFRRFKDTAFRLGIREDWFRYRDDAFERIAIEWFDEHSIPCVRSRTADEC